MKRSRSYKKKISRTANTKKSNSSRSRTSKTQRHYSIKGLYDWHDHEFRHLGWMVLSKHNGVNDKVKVYKNSVNRLLKAIEQEMREYHNDDKLHDLKILHSNVMVLKKQANKL